MSVEEPKGGKDGQGCDRKEESVKNGSVCGWQAKVD